MMNKMIRFYNQNRKEIWKVLGIIAFFIIILQVLNWWTKKSNEEKLSNISTSNNTVVSESSSNQIQINSQSSAITGNKIDSEMLQEQTNIITSFLEECNNGNMESAYNMLTKECKEELYPSISDFKIYYYGNFFNEPRASFEIENWFGTTYKIDITPDLLSTGKVNNYEVKQDYITLEEVDGEYKLNVNSYIGRNIKDKEKEQENIYFKINYVDTYMDYEKYNITVKNNNSKTIYLDTKKNVKSMYLEDKKGIKYFAITNEIQSDDLVYIPLEEKTFDIKYYNKYSSSKTIKKIVFSNVILESDEEKIISISI